VPDVELTRFEDNDRTPIILLIRYDDAAIAELRAMISPDPDPTGRRYLAIRENENGRIGQIVQVQRLNA
jgi:hypothetical protein